MLTAKTLSAVAVGIGLTIQLTGLTIQLTVRAQERPAGAPPPMELTALDYVQIQQLVARYAQYIDTWDARRHAASDSDSA